MDSEVNESELIRIGGQIPVLLTELELTDELNLLEDFHKSFQEIEDAGIVLDKGNSHVVGVVDHDVKCLIYVGEHSSA